MIVRTVLAVIALVVASSAMAQQSQPVPAPDRHDATGLSFPQRIALTDKTTSNDYGKAMNRPDLGYSWNYGVQGQMSATVYVYRLKADKIPSGAANPVVLAQFQQAYGDIQALAKDRYEELKITRPAGDCPVAGVVFRCMTLSGIQIRDKSRVETSLMVTGYRNHFVKLRIDWVPGPQAEAAVSGFLAALASQMR